MWPSFLFLCCSLAHIQCAVNSPSQAATVRSSGWELIKSPVIADHPRARYSPDTEMVAMVTLTAGHGQVHYKTHEVERVSAWVGNPFDNTMRKHAKALWLLSFTQTRIRADGGIGIFICLSYPLDRKANYLCISKVGWSQHGVLDLGNVSSVDISLGRVENS